MTTFPGSPRILKGAIISFELPKPVPKVIVFQYNPGTLTRSLAPQVSGGEGGRAGPLRFKGAPVETVSLEVEIDAADQLEKGDTAAASLGIHPQLAALETLLYPRSNDIQSNVSQLNAGIIEIVPPLAPFTLFVYGAKRILPVQVTDLRVTEEAHDINLNPIQAKISLSLKVLSYNDLPPDHPGYSLFLTHQVVKETLAQAGITHGLDALGIGPIHI